MRQYGVFIEGQEVLTEETYEVIDKYKGEAFAVAGEANARHIEAAVTSAKSAFQTPYAVHERYLVIERAIAIMERDRESIAQVLVREAGKPIRDARGEVDRSIQTLRFSSVAARTLKGEEVLVQANPGSENRLAWTLRKPYGVTLAITPFNFPLNLSLHKVGPALAAGNPVILKPSPDTPLTALKIAEIFTEAGLRPGWISVLTGQAPALGQQLVAHPEVSLITFTGSVPVGRAIRQAAGLRPVILELGNNSANIVHGDADINQASRILAQRAFGFAGQVCISVQRIYVQQEIYGQFAERIADETRKLVVGDPHDEATDVGPMINTQAADRAWQRLHDALDQGARSLVQGTRSGALLGPSILENVSPSMAVMSEEVFAPLAGLVPYEHFDQALQWANAGSFGLQAGVFTQNINRALKAAQTLQVGGVIINDSSSYRADNMPYGGIKDSGIGREGPEYAVEQYTYPTVVVFNISQ